jgi:nucleotide-binding universal stress UspA family protein
MAIMPVVVGVDGSEESMLAVQWAAREAAWHGAPLRIVSAAAVPPCTRLPGALPPAVADALRAISVRALGEAATRAADVTNGLIIDTDLLTAPPALAGTPPVAVSASGAGAQMLVVGARGAGGFAAMLLGSVSGYAAAHAPCPVVVTRMATSAASREVAVGLRDLHDADAILGFAFEEAALRGASLVAVHSCYWLPAGLWGPGASEATRRAGIDAEQACAEVGRDLADVLARWQDKYPAVPVRLDVVHGHPARMAASYSAHVELVVIGRGGDPATGPAIAAVQQAALEHARGPVAVVPVP